MSPDAAGVPRAKLFAEGLGLYGDDAASATDLAGLVRGDGPDDDRVVCSDVVAAGRFCSGAPSRAADPTVPCAIM